MRWTRFFCAVVMGGVVLALAPHPGTAQDKGINVPNADAEMTAAIAGARKGPAFAGLFSNDPNDVTNVRRGQRYDFTDAEITDWMFMRNGKIVGKATLRPLLERFSISWNRGIPKSGRS